MVGPVPLKPTRNRTAKYSSAEKVRSSTDRPFSSGSKPGGRQAPLRNRSVTNSDSKKNSMMEREMMQLEKIKKRQQKEIEAMLENERRQEEIRMKNKLKELKEREREEKRAKEIAQKRLDAARKKAQDD